MSVGKVPYLSVLPLFLGAVARVLDRMGSRLDIVVASESVCTAILRAYSSASSSVRGAFPSGLDILAFRGTTVPSRDPHVELGILFWRRDSKNVLVFVVG